ncbi:30S ribosomal protein S4, partial [candidate division WOR-3 bacterium]|nr:30S ribosomal protein S4 [candidate division WOR-3 bacterium]
VGDVITVREKSKDIPFFSEALAHEIEVKEWLTIKRRKMEGKVTGEPKREDIEYPIKENLIVELYSK